MSFKYAEAFVELAWKTDRFDSGGSAVSHRVKSIGQQLHDMSAAASAASRSTSADVYELQSATYRLAQTAAAVPPPLKSVGEATLATGAAMKNLGGAVGIVSPALGGMISTVGQMSARMAVLAQTQGNTASAAVRLGDVLERLSRIVLAFVGTPLGLFLAGITAMIGLLTSAQREGESLGDTLLRLTDILHGLARAQAQANRELERSGAIAQAQFEREERARREKAERTPEGRAVSDVVEESKDIGKQIAELEKNKAAAEKERKWRQEDQIGTTDFRSREAMTEEERKYAERSKWLEVATYSSADLDSEIRSLDLDIQKLKNDRKRVESVLPELNAAQKAADTKRFFGLDPSKSAAEIRRESETKVRDRETQERLEQERNRTRRAQAEDDRMRQQAEEDKRRREDDAQDRARAAEEAARDKERERERDRRARGVLRGMGLDEGERVGVGMAAAMGNVGDVLGAIAAGADAKAEAAPPAAARRFGATNVAGVGGAIQDAIFANQQDAIARQQAENLDQVAQGKKPIKVQVMNPQGGVALFAN